MANPPQTEAEKQQQQHAKARLRQQCSVGHQPGHFSLVSERWGPGLHMLQAQRNKRKADQAFDTAPLGACELGPRHRLAAFG